MDFFDPQKQRRHSIRLAIGYAVIGAVLTLATTVLLHYTLGYGLDKEGRLIRNGLVFVSSQPVKADVYLDGNKYKDETNTRMTLPSGQYVMELKKNGYHDWKRTVTVEGGSVERFDYPLLIPTQLNTTALKQYDKAPSLSTSSPNGRWLIVAPAGQNKFDLYDLSADTPSGQAVEVPSDILAAGSTTKGWAAVEWSRNNRHVLLSRSFDAPGRSGSEYILFDRENPGESQNLSVVLGFTPTKIELRDRNHDQYYLHDAGSGQLFTASLENPTPKPLVKGVLAFASDKDVVAYVTVEGADKGKAVVKIQKGTGEPLTVRQIPAGEAYVADMAIYDRTLYLAVGSSADNRVFLYGDPIGSLRRNPGQPAVPVQILKVEGPVRVSFSQGGRFVAAENGDKFATYDAETDRGYVYRTGAPLDKPQRYSSWIDGYHLSYVSEGQVVIFDFDGANFSKLSPASPLQLPVFDLDGRYLYNFSAKNALTRTALLTPEDL